MTAVPPSDPNMTSVEPVGETRSLLPLGVDGLDSAVDVAGTDPGEAGPGALALVERLGVSFTVADVLDRARNVPDDDFERFLDPKLAHLSAPDKMADRELFADRVASALRNNEKIAVFGDYDCDGITATAIMTGVLRSLGAEVAPLLATRTEGAYGFSNPALKRVRATGAKLLITCDCGSSDHERIAAARASGIETLVIDHHLVPTEPLPALGFLNPHRPDCGFEYKWLASCGLALSVGAALRQKLGKNIDLRPYLDLVAIGTIADVAPLTGDNRALVRAGLRVLGSGARPGLRALGDLARFDFSKGVIAEDVAFRIAPRLNAPGRLGDPDEALELLLTRDSTMASALAGSIEQTQLRRRALQAQMVDEALADIRDGGFDALAGIVLARQDWHPGVVGIVAGRVADTFGKPTIVVGLEGATGRGSVRGPRGFPLHDALTLCRAELVGFGGHQAAAGVHVDATRIDAIRAAWHDACRELGKGRPSQTDKLATVRLDPRDDPRAVLADLLRLEPCGEGNPAPRLLLPSALVKSARNLKGHLKIDIAFGPHSFSGIAFSRGELVDSVAGTRRDIVGTLRANTFQGGVELTVISI